MPGLKVLQQYLNIMHIFSYDANYKRRLWKRMNERRLERDLEKVNRFFPGPKNQSASVVTIATSTNGGSGRKCHLPMQIISFDIEESKDSR